MMVPSQLSGLTDGILSQPAMMDMLWLGVIKATIGGA